MKWSDEMEEIVLYLASHKGEILRAAVEHITLSGLAVLIGFGISLGICILAVMKDADMDKVINRISFFRLIPGVAILVVAMPVLGVGFLPALCTLTLVTIPSILVNLYAGMKNIAADTMESAVGIGLSRKQILFQVQLPMAKPFLLLGIRTAIVDAVTIAAVASLMGAGGLGRYVMTGLAVNDYRLVVIGGVLITAMALAGEILFGWMQRSLEYKYTGRH
ncbi:ABC transporter permease [Diplocloster modestus]|uniref:ABC transporter permease n=1 Tax=Diplocloster modestus TaxID=2850322 RepID=A0ABS6KDN5_9FIRM|nr:ABC transporter permease [Diplocloster modestus]MBU9728617.1 ABC transporter permease [Diplocloster modestus]